MAASNRINKVAIVGVRYLKPSVSPSVTYLTDVLRLAATAVAS